jgi:uncharacterized MAPEG superfamily protein
MKPEMIWLVWAVALAFVQVLVAVTGAFTQVGLMKLVGNRDDMPKLTGWVGRAERAHLNMVGNLVLFAALETAVAAMGRSTETTMLGAQLFVWCRVAYAVIYLAGLPWLRTLSWVGSVIGLVMIFLQLVK